MSTFSAEKFAKSLKESIERKVNSRLKETTYRKRDAMMRAGNQWKIDVRGWLSKKRPGDTPGSHGNNQPFMITGALRKAVHYITGPIQHNRTTNIWSFTMKNWFDPVYSYDTHTVGKGKSKRVTGYSRRSKSQDYSDILNETKGKYYSGYKTRATKNLHDRMSKILRNKRYK